MNCDQVKASLIDYAENQLSPEEKAEIDEHLDRCQGCRAELDQTLELLREIERQPDRAPPPAIREAFNKMLFREMERQSMARESSPKAWLSSWRDLFSVKPALLNAFAALLLLGGFALGYFLRISDNPMATAANRHEIERLQTEIESLKNVYLVNSLSLPRPSQRLQALTDYKPADTLSAEARDAYLHALSHDSNVNVRFAALRILSRHSARQDIREGLLDALPKEKEPLIQVSIIRMLSDIGDRRVIPSLESIIVSEEASDYVKGFAMNALHMIELGRNTRTIENETL